MRGQLFRLYDSARNKPILRGFGTVSKPLPKLRLSTVNFSHPKPAETVVKLRRNHSETEAPVSAETVLTAPPYRGPQRFGFGFADFPTRHRERVTRGKSNPRVSGSPLRGGDGRGDTTPRMRAQCNVCGSLSQPKQNMGSAER